MTNYTADAVMKVGDVAFDELARVKEKAGRMPHGPKRDREFERCGKLAVTVMVGEQERRVFGGGR